MARLHSKAKGKSKSHKPFVTEAPDWIPLKKEEVEQLIIGFYKKGTPMPQIGSILRDQYGIPSIKLICGRKMTTILEENDLKPEYPEDLIDLIRRAMTLRNHLIENRKDLSSMHGLRLIESKIYRLSAHLRKTGRISVDWKYDHKKASVLIR